MREFDHRTDQRSQYLGPHANVRTLFTTQRPVINLPLVNGSLYNFAFQTSSRFHFFFLPLLPSAALPKVLSFEFKKEINFYFKL